mmetsp:Transcript_16523/g.39904  ORF Transcript_16523/g.39904 Transcript_16523/m.39904 type:complete len:338 (-) Transcript_16523:717-1730(-)
MGVAHDVVVPACAEAMRPGAALGALPRAQVRLRVRAELHRRQVASNLRSPRVGVHHVRGVRRVRRVHRRRSEVVHTGNDVRHRCERTCARRLGITQVGVVSAAARRNIHRKRVHGNGRDRPHIVDAVHQVLGPSPNPADGHDVSGAERVPWAGHHCRPPWGNGLNGGGSGADARAGGRACGRVHLNPELRPTAHGALGLHGASLSRRRRGSPIGDHVLDVGADRVPLRHATAEENTCVGAQVDVDREGGWTCDHNTVFVVQQLQSRFRKSRRGGDDHLVPGVEAVGRGSQDGGPVNGILHTRPISRREINDLRLRRGVDWNAEHVGTDNSHNVVGID